MAEDPDVVSRVEEARDAEVHALESLATAIDDNARDERVLARRVRRLSAARSLGRSWHELLDADSKPGPLDLSARILCRATDVSATLRRRVARGLRSEGASISAVARRFGVSHQRVSTLLRHGTPRPASDAER